MMFSLKDFRPTLTIASPGRINFIGEHTDYNDGFVLPTAIDKKIYFYLRPNQSNECRVYSKNFDKWLNADLSQIARSEQEWENYLLGVIAQIQKKTDKLQGFDCVLESFVPVGSGVSSSAALECGLAFGLNELFGLGLGREDIAFIGQRAEHEYVGTKCGIMDQYASVMSKENHVILLDCQSMESEMIPANFGDYQILLLNTNVAHSLASSEYNTRREECESVVSLLQQKYPQLQSLRGATIEMLDAITLTDLQRKRSSYVVEENMRVEKAVKALKESDLETFGKLMYQSHEGLQHKYEVSCPELDFLVDCARPYQETILGARMMGGGFGGCTINLIHREAIADFVTETAEAYRQKFGIELTPFEAKASVGTTILTDL